MSHIHKDPATAKLINRTWCPSILFPHVYSDFRTAKHFLMALLLYLQMVSSHHFTEKVSTSWYIFAIFYSVNCQWAKRV